MNKPKGWLPGGHVFIDESKAGDYLLIAVGFPASKLEKQRKAIRKLILKGQFRVHMKQEGDSRRREILSTIVGLKPKVKIFRTTKLHFPYVIEQRGACLDALVSFAAEQRQRVLTFELDISELRRDEIRLSRAIKNQVAEKTVIFRHARASEEPLLVVADAVGWAFARGDDWRRRLSHLEIEIIDV